MRRGTVITLELMLQRFSTSRAAVSQVSLRRASLNTASLSSVQFSFFAVPPRSLHHRLKGRLRAPRSTQVLSTRSLGLLNGEPRTGRRWSAVWCRACPFGRNFENSRTPRPQRETESSVCAGCALTHFPKNHFPKTTLHAARSPRSYIYQPLRQHTISRPASWSLR